MSGIFPFLTEKTGWKQLSLTFEEGTLGGSWGSSTRGAKSAVRYDGCIPHGDAGRLTFFVGSPSSPSKLLMCETVDAVILLWAF